MLSSKYTLSTVKYVFSAQSSIEQKKKTLCILNKIFWFILVSKFTNTQLK